MADTRSFGGNTFVESSRTTTIRVIVDSTGLKTEVRGDTTRVFRELGREEEAAAVKTRKFRREIVTTQKSIRELTREALALSAVVPTIIKALVSGAVITATFGAIFAVFNTLRAVLVSIPDELARTTDELKRMELGLQAVIATTNRFAADFAENFRIAGQVARQLRSELIKLDPQTLGGLRELQVATQAILSAGGSRFFKDTKELAQAASLFVNSVALLTGRLNDERQIFSEIKEFLLGNVRANNQIASLIAAQVGNLDEWLDRLSRSDDALKEIKGVLSGIDEAAEDFGNTLEGAEASLKSAEAILAEKTFELALSERVKLLKEQADLFQRAAKDQDVLRGRQVIFNNIFFKLGILLDRLKLKLQAVIGRKVRLNDPLRFRDNLDDANESAIDLKNTLTDIVGITQENVKLLSSLERLRNKVSSAEVAALKPTDPRRLAISRAASSARIDRELIDPLRKQIDKIADILFNLPAGSKQKTILEKQLRTAIDNLQNAIGLANRLDEALTRAFRRRVSDEAERKRQKDLREDAALAAEILKNRRDHERVLSKMERERRERQRRFFRTQRESLGAARREREKDARIEEQLRNLRVSGLQTTLTVEERVRQAREAFVRKAIALEKQLSDAGFNTLKFKIDLKKALKEGTDELRKQLTIQDQITKAGALVRRFRLEQEGVIVPGITPLTAEDLKEEIKKQEKIALDVTVSEGTRERAVVRIAAIRSELERLIDPAEQLDRAFGRLNQSLADIFTGKIDLKKGFQDLNKAILELLKSTALWASVFSRAISSAIQGQEKFVTAIVKGIGSIIVALGNQLIAKGTLGIFEGLLSGDVKQIALGAAAIARGVALVALGRAMGGGGPSASAANQQGAPTAEKTPTFAFNQALLDLQQSLQTQQGQGLAQATANLNNAVGKIGSLPFGEALVIGADQKGGLTSLLAKDASKSSSLTAASSLGNTLLGGRG